MEVVIFASWYARDEAISVAATSYGKYGALRSYNETGETTKSVHAAATTVSMTYYMYAKAQFRTAWIVATVLPLRGLRRF